MIANKLRIRCTKSLYLIPFFFTFANAMLGVLAVFKAIDSEFIAAAYCILLAAFCDALDGRLARKFNTTTMLGMELDSLCDAISFCVAPVVLLYSWEVQDFGFLGLIGLMIYLCAGLFRLARFNVITENNKISNSFLGLPTPVAAFFIICLVLCKDSIPLVLSDFILCKNVLVALVILISFLMISNIQFPSFKQNNLIVMPCAFLVMIGITYGNPLILLVPTLYIFSGLINCCYLTLKKMLINKEKKIKII